MHRKGCANAPKRGTGRPAERLRPKNPRSRPRDRSGSSTMRFVTRPRSPRMKNSSRLRGPAKRSRAPIPGASCASPASSSRGSIPSRRFAKGCRSLDRRARTRTIRSIKPPRRWRDCWPRRGSRSSPARDRGSWRQPTRGPAWLVADRWGATSSCPSNRVPTRTSTRSSTSGISLSGRRCSSNIQTPSSYSPGGSGPWMKRSKRLPSSRPARSTSFR